MLHCKVRDPQSVGGEVGENRLLHPTTVLAIMYCASRYIQAKHNHVSVLDRAIENYPLIRWCDGFARAKVHVVSSSHVVVSVVEINLSKVLGMLWGNICDPQ
jgi:hypothetical protein